MKASTVRTIITSLNNANVRYLVVGGLAVAAHGYVRYTEDIDLVVALDRDNVLRAVKILETLGYRPRVPVPAMDFADATKREMWIREKGMIVFQMISDKERETPIDLFVTEPFDFEKEWKGALRLPVAGDEALAPVVSYDQLIALKLAAGRPTDLIDIDKLRQIRNLEGNGGRAKT